MPAACLLPGIRAGLYSVWNDSGTGIFYNYMYPCPESFFWFTLIITLFLVHPYYNAFKEDEKDS